jgi:hypothetical protein
MPTNIGTSTSYIATVPALSESADIQVALRLLGYGSATEPINDAAISANSVFGKIRDITTGKANIASPTFTGTVTLPTGTQVAAPLRIGQSTQANLLLTPLANSIEASVEGFYATVANGPGRGLINARQMVFLLANSSSVTTTATNVFPTPNDVLSSLQPAKLYRFRGTYYANVSYSAPSPNLQILFAFSNAPTSIKYNFKTYRQAGQTTIDYSGLISIVGTSQITNTITSSGGYVVEFEGYFLTHATNASTFAPQVRMSAGGASVVMETGSWIEVEKLGANNQPVIAGNWG